MNSACSKPRPKPPAPEKMSANPDIVINFQGDAPLTPPWFIEALIENIAKDPSVDMATPVLRLDKETYQNFRKKIAFTYIS